MCQRICNRTVVGWEAISACSSLTFDDDVYIFSNDLALINDDASDVFDTSIAENIDLFCHAMYIEQLLVTVVNHAQLIVVCNVETMSIGCRSTLLPISLSVK